MQTKTVNPIVWCRDPQCTDWSFGFQSESGHEHNHYRPRMHEATGLLDMNGESIREGDVLEEEYNEFYGWVRVVVRWDGRKGAWISYGEFAGGGAHGSLNAEHFPKCRKVGEIDKNRNAYYPAKKIHE